MAKGRQSSEMIKESFVDTGADAYILHTMGNAATESVITLPNTAKGIRITPVTTGIFYAVYTGTVRAADATNPTSGVAVAASAFDTGPGSYAAPDISDVRLLPAYDGVNARKISLIGTSNAQVVRIEVF